MQKDRILICTEIESDILTVSISDAGVHFHEIGGYVAKERKETRNTRWKKAGDWVQKFVPVFISVATFILAAVVFWKQTKSDETIKSQKAAIDSLTVSIKKLSLQKLSK